MSLLEVARISTVLPHLSSLLPLPEKLLLLQLHILPPLLLVRVLSSPMQVCIVRILLILPSLPSLLLLRISLLPLPLLPISLFLLPASSVLPPSLQTFVLQNAEMLRSFHVHAVAMAGLLLHPGELLPPRSFLRAAVPRLLLRLHLVLPKMYRSTVVWQLLLF